MGNPLSTLTILNFTGNTLTATVDPSINCCDAPTAGQAFGFVPGSTSNPSSADMDYIKKSGHSCDGNQGTFILDVISNGIPAFSQAFSFDSGGNIFMPSIPASPYQNCLLAGRTWMLIF